MMMRKAILSISLLMLCALPATAQTLNPFAGEETVQHLAHTGPNFRIRRGSGSVTVNANGSITIAPAAGQLVNTTRAATFDDAVTVTGTTTFQGAVNYSLLGGPGALIIDGTGTASDVALSNSQAVVGTSVGAGIPAATTIEILLSTTAGVNLNTTTPTVLFTCPASTTCIATKVIVRNASVDLPAGSAGQSLTFQSVALDWGQMSLGTSGLINSARYDPILAGEQGNAFGAYITFRTMAAAQTFTAAMDAEFGSAATVTIDVFGYMF